MPLFHGNKDNTKFALNAVASRSVEAVGWRCATHNERLALALLVHGAWLRCFSMKLFRRDSESTVFVLHAFGAPQSLACASGRRHET